MSRLASWLNHWLNHACDISSSLIGYFTLWTCTRRNNNKSCSHICNEAIDRAFLVPGARRLDNLRHVLGRPSCGLLQRKTKLRISAAVSGISHLEVRRQYSSSKSATCSQLRRPQRVEQLPRRREGRDCLRHDHVCLHVAIDALLESRCTGLFRLQCKAISG